MNGVRGDIIVTHLVNKVEKESAIGVSGKAKTCRTIPNSFYINLMDKYMANRNVIYILLYYQHRNYFEYHTIIMAPTLEQVFTMRLYRSEAGTVPLGSTRGSGVRVVTPYESGYLRGASSDTNTINASLIQGSANTLRIDMNASPAPTTFLDARVHFRDEKLGAAFYVRFEGVARVDEHIQKILDGSDDARTTESKDHYEFNSPIFEVSREEDRWMESTLWVGHGHYVVERKEGEMKVAVEFEVYRLVSG